MSRSIKILREPYTFGVTEEDVRAAALQYVQIVSGYRVPPAATADAFGRAVESLTTLTQDLLEVVEANADEAHAEALQQCALRETVLREIALERARATTTLAQQVMSRRS